MGVIGGNTIATFQLCLVREICGLLTGSNRPPPKKQLEAIRAEKKPPAREKASSKRPKEACSFLANDVSQPKHQDAGSPGGHDQVMWTFPLQTGNNRYHR
jgi:hypothetical protein